MGLLKSQLIEALETERLRIMGEWYCSECDQWYNDEDLVPVREPHGEVLRWCPTCVGNGELHRYDEMPSDEKFQI
jgi:hypothetical protein